MAGVAQNVTVAQVFSTQIVDFPLVSPGTPPAIVPVMTTQATPTETADLLTALVTGLELTEDEIAYLEYQYRATKAMSEADRVVRENAE